MDYEQQINDALAEDELADGILGTWLQSVPDANHSSMFEEFDLLPNLSVEEVIERASKFDQSLNELYRALADSSEDFEIRELFSSLIEMEDAKDRR